jgi:large subunit ribosomal protein L18
MSKEKINVHGTKDRPRLVIFRSLKYIYGQIVDDDHQKIILTVSNVGKKLPQNIKNAKTKVEASKEVGKTMASLATKKNINEVIFDRNGYLYHGRVKAFAEGAREGGLKF